MNSQRFLRISTDVQKQQTIAMDPAAHLRPHKHRQCLLSHYHLPQLHKGAATRLPDLHMSPDNYIMLPTITYRMRLDQSHARSLLYRPMYQMRLRRPQLRRDRQSTSLHPRLPRHLEHWVLKAKSMRLLLKDCTAPDYGTVLLVTMPMLCTIGPTLPACRMVHRQQCRHLQTSTMADSRTIPTSHNLL